MSMSPAKDGKPGFATRDNQSLQPELVAQRVLQFNLMEDPNTQDHRVVDIGRDL